MGNVVTPIQDMRAEQQPDWGDPAQVQRVRSILAARPPLVRLEDVLTLRALLAKVAQGEAHVIQSGDCAEDPEESTAAHVWRKSAVLDLLAATLKMATHAPVLRVGRIAGQFAKPRSQPTERVGELELPVYRGHMVNAPHLSPDSRDPDPLRILTGYMAANDIIEHLGWRRPPSEQQSIEPQLWTSHEALLLDYEIPMLREAADGRRWLGSTHWPWIGERTRQLEGAHVALLSGVVNPVACKVGPRMTEGEIVDLCDRLDPGREPGRLTLISRMGADAVADRLPPLVEAVRAAGHPVIWLTDPMHGNTVSAPSGHKTRLVATVADEVRGFRLAVLKAGGVAGGLHLETTPDEVTECADDIAGLDSVGERYASFCDPRLTPAQAARVVSAWGDAAQADTAKER
jgi:3-deoxy-7-phosphoheptulonate synthase